MFTRDGKLLKEGDTVFLPKFGDTLERIANNGAKEFYNSSLSAIIAKEVQENGGIITTDDLANYKVDVKEPLTVPLGDGERTVYAVRPPSSGAVLAFILNILDRKLILSIKEIFYSFLHFDIFFAKIVESIHFADL